MRFVRSLVPVLFSLPLIGVACGSEDDHEAYATFEDCYVEHTDVEAFDSITAIKICCIDHPIGPDDFNIVCGETAQDCVDYVDAQLTDPDLLLTDIEQACDEYLIERNQ